ncbi:MAG TPA: hypothetical protein VMI75_09530, partial [Polyangiaceae bacterium]|nr:hypothetical protein [Polyangiaceae bacterium]
MSVPDALAADAHRSTARRPSPLRGAGRALWSTLVAALAASALARAAPASSEPADPARLAGRHTTLPSPSSMYPPSHFRAKEFAFIHANGYFHLFWMRNNLHEVPDSTENDLGHAISTDLVHWTQLDTLLEARPDNWDSWHIWSPTIYQSGST